MSDEIKEILDKLQGTVLYGSLGLTERERIKLLDYITYLEEKEKILEDKNIELVLENERLNNNQVRALNKIKDFINSSKCEIVEGFYTNDKHSQYWKMFKHFVEELKNLIKGININNYIYISKEREEELLNQEKQYIDYKSRCEKLREYINTHQLFKFIYDDEELFEIITDKEAKKDLENILNGGDE